MRKQSNNNTITPRKIVIYETIIGVLKASISVRVPPFVRSITTDATCNKKAIKRDFSTTVIFTHPSIPIS